MAKATFTASQLEEQIERLRTADKDFPDYPITMSWNGYEPRVWEEETWPLTFRKVGEDKNVRVEVEEYFGGEEGGDHRMYIIFKVGWGEDARYFEKTGEYNSWDDSTWDGGFYEVVSQEVKRTEWVSKK